MWRVCQLKCKMLNTKLSTNNYCKEIKLKFLSKISQKMGFLTSVDPQKSNNS